MSFISNIGRQLVQRRLWPVAILLVAALAAVPLALAKDPEVPPAETVAPPEPSDLETAPIVTAAQIDAVNSRRVLGKTKNPFAVPKPASATVVDDEPTESQLPADSGDSGDGDANVSSPPSTGGGVTTPGAPGVPLTPATPSEPAKTYDKYDLTVRFGDSDSSLERKTLKRLQPLPASDDLPALIYLGVSKDGKSALFLLEQGVQVVGDGECDPTPEDCETLRLRAGETEFLDVVDATGTTTAQYQLDLVKIHKGETASASKASASSKAGRDLLAERGRLPFRFDVDSGTLERRSGVVGDVARATASIG